MLFPFQLAYSQYQTKRSDRPSRAIVQQVMELLRNPVAEKFIASIELLNLPEKKLQSHLTGILMNIRTNSEYTNEEYHRELAQTIETVFENPLRGPIVDQMQIFKATVEQLLQLDRKYIASHPIRGNQI